MDLKVLIILGILFLCITMCKSENFEDSGQNIMFGNPRIYYPIISEEADRNDMVAIPNTVEYPWAKNKNNYGETEILDDGKMGNLGLNFNMCSKSCCSEQPTLPFKMMPDDFVLQSGEKYVSSNINCSNAWQDSGCVCLTKNQALFLNRRGNNAHNDV